MTGRRGGRAAGHPTGPGGTGRADAARADAVRVDAVRLGPRSAAAVALVSLVGVVAFGWPLLAGANSGLAEHSADAPWLFALLLPLLLAVVLAQISEGRGDATRGMDAKAVAMLGVLAAAGAALRPVGAGVAGLEPMFFLMVLAGRALGAGFGFVLGAVTMFASALLTGGVGPWMPFQMLCMGWVSMGAGLLPGAGGRRALRGRPELLLLAGYGAVSAAGYGILMNLQGWPYLAGLSSSISFVPGDPLADNLTRFAAYVLATSLGWDVPRAALTAVLCLVLGRPVLLALRRATRRAAFAAPVAFAGPADPTEPEGSGKSG
ncbi:energy-coupling factor transport system substrate-specific component [Allostreptomyces psammosilenae]|uniref:Energy-coupling factor transport system substrate-specific component n=1 Tax=Allostreptomyces psammosilenae TaxID=1892865 RepID=A0A852ZZZ5_9ACTN|nr:energy-coupling factor transport system substrate-specific component [Allostreptomyces psammosilenae]